MNHTIKKDSRLSTATRDQSQNLVPKQSTMSKFVVRCSSDDTL